MLFGTVSTGVNAFTTGNVGEAISCRCRSSITGRVGVEAG